MFFMPEFYSFISFFYIDKNPEMKLINYNDVESTIEDDDTGEQYQVA
jgi:hypothetical protein